MNIAELIPYENNPRKNEDAVPDVAESIKQCGDLDPIEIDENNVILSGHTRLLALIEQGFTETDVIKYTGLTEEQKRKYRILANKAGEKSKWDFDLLAEELENLDFDEYDFDFNLPNFDDDEKPIKEVEYKEKISVVIDCEDDEEAERIFSELTEEGYECRISTL
jgi:uncharacterized glyoxalase superfamily protein PhnB